MTMLHKLRNSLFLMIAALIWGFAFAFQRLGGDAMGPLTLNTLRSFLGCAALLPVCKLVYGSLKPNHATLVGGIECGLCLSVACNLQQLGLMYTSPGKAGFITASYMILVAAAGLFSKKKPGAFVLAAVILGTAGLFLICIPSGEQLSVNKGDLMCIGCALFYALQIIVIDRVGEEAESVKMCAIQFLVCGIVSAVLMFLFEDPTLKDIASGLIPLLYVGIMSTAVAYTLQMVGMKGQNPAVASLIMSLESVFSVVGELVVFGTMMSGRALLGCVIMFIAILLSQAELMKTAGSGEESGR